MIEIRNVSNEPIEVLSHYDPTCPGFRCEGDPPKPSRIDPGASLVTVGYEPGVHLEIRPVHDWGMPRLLHCTTREG